MKKLGILVALAALAPFAHGAEAGPAEAEVRSLVAAAAKGRNPSESASPELKKWLATYGESVTGVKDAGIKVDGDVVITRKGENLYVHSFDRKQRIVCFMFDGEVVESYNLSTGRPVIFENTPYGFVCILLEWHCAEATPDLVMRFKVKGGTGARITYACGKTVPKKFKDSTGYDFPYRLYEPKNLAAGEKAPLVVFLHGAGERGAGNAAQMIIGVPYIIKDAESRGQPIFLIAGQVPGGTTKEFPEGHKWVQVAWGGSDTVDPMPKEPSMSMRALIELIDVYRRDPRVDTSRIYVTGVSMGGYGTWDLVLRRPDWFAAAMPVCAGVDLAQVPKAKSVPFWIFHGGSDSVVPIVRGRNSYRAAKDAGLDVRYTEFLGIDHDSWTLVYPNKTYLDWLYAQRRK